MDFSQLDDMTLIRRYQKDNDVEALSHLFIRYKTMVYGVCLKYLKNSSEAEDATMELYQVLLRRIKNKNIDQFRTWFYVLVKNHCFEELRSHSRKREKQENADIVYSQNIYHPNSKGKEDELIRMHACLEKLKVDQRESVRLFYLEQKTYEEVGKLLNLEWKKVRSHIQNGRRNLKICMDKNVN